MSISGIHDGHEIGKEDRDDNSSVNKSFFQASWDFLGIPFRFVLFDQAWLPRFGWTTLEQERRSKVLPFVKGRLLDIGAGRNHLVREYGNGIGVDVHDWGGGVVVVEDTSRLPYADGSFDTVTLIAALNHIPNRDAVLKEAHRVLQPEGRLIVTMIPPQLGNMGHKFWWYDEHHKRGGMKQGEVGGMTRKQVVSLCDSAGFCLTGHKTFQFHLNNIYLFEKKR